MFNIAVVGEIVGNWALQDIVDKKLQLISGFLTKADKEAKIKFIVSDAYTGNGWYEKIKNRNDDICGYFCGENKELEGLCTNVIRFDTNLRNLIGEEICDRADLIVMVWNEDVTQFKGACWEILQIAHQRKTPLLWVSAKDGSVYWAVDSFYETYTDDKIETQCDLYNEAVIVAEKAENKKIPFLSLGKVLRSRFLKKHSAVFEKMDSTGDVMLSEEESFKMDNPDGEKLRQKLLKIFKAFDNSAIEFNDKYQTVIYWRAVLPFVATVFLAIGFYAETILGVIEMPERFWILVAGIGFLLHGLVNLYVDLLSRNEVIKKWHQSYVTNRYIAEVLRVIIHFTPYGFNLNLRKICGANNKIYRTVKDAAEIDGNYSVDRKTINDMLSHLEEFLEDQIAYHKASASRYSRIVKFLSNGYRIFFAVGFSVVILRALFQFAVALRPLPGMLSEAIALNKYGSSFANMVALVLPAVASYFMSKLSLCNFKYNYDNHTNMQAVLSALLVRVKNLQTSSAGVPIEVVNALGEDIATSMVIEDTSGWMKKYTGTTVKRL